MKVDIDDVLFWMDAIRDSDDRYRTLESFWKGQIHSKIWLIEKLSEFITQADNVAIYGGWNGVLASLIFNSDIEINNVLSIDLDPQCYKIANTVNKRYEIQGRFTAMTQDMCDCNIFADLIINTSCEHITQKQYNSWIAKQAPGSTVVLQGNNYDIPEHIRLSKNIEQFKSQCSGVEIIQSYELALPLYTRFMVIGKR